MPHRAVGFRGMSGLRTRHALLAAGAALVIAGCALVAAGRSPGIAASLVVWGLALVSYWFTTLTARSGRAPASRRRRG